MKIKDFFFGDKRLSDLGYMIGYAVTSPSTSIPMGSDTTFNSYTNQITYETDFLKSKYDTNLEITFDIVKDLYSNKKDTYLNDIECSFLMKWLNRKDIHDFIAIYDDSSFNNIVYHGTFTKFNQINIGGKCIGINVTFTSNAPWGYEKTRNNSYLIPNGGGNFKIMNDSDEVGFLYPTFFEIKIKENGNFELSNSLDNKKTVIKNCTIGEVITFNCKRQIINSNYYVPGKNENHSKFMNDFNYNYPRLVLEYDNNENDFNVNVGCEIKISYSPVRKVGIII